jgi:hypothetical protein
VNNNGELDDLLELPDNPPNDNKPNNKPAPWGAPTGTLAIEDYLRSAWGDSVYEQSLFAQLARSEAEREHTLRARPKKGKQR